jgi:hypothetical protein
MMITKTFGSNQALRYRAHHLFALAPCLRYEEAESGKLRRAEKQRSGS